jgi:hypothetical protein
MSKGGYFMFLDVIVRPTPPGQYTAQVYGIPELRAVAATQQEALEQVRQLLTTWAAEGKWVRVDVPMDNIMYAVEGFPPKPIDPNDPMQLEYLAEIARYREEMDRLHQEDEPPCPSDSSSTPTT